MNMEWFLQEEKLYKIMAKKTITQSILDFGEEDHTEIKEYFWNGTVNYWYDMPEFDNKGHNGIDQITIEFDSDEEVDQFGKEILDMPNFWSKRMLTTKGMWYPIKDTNRNKGLVYQHKDNVDLDQFDIISSDEIIP